MNKLIKDLFEEAAFETEYDDNQNLNELIERFAELLIQTTIAEFTEQLSSKVVSLPANPAYFRAIRETERILLKD